MCYYREDSCSLWAIEWSLNVFDRAGRISRVLCSSTDPWIQQQVIRMGRNSLSFLAFMTRTVLFTLLSNEFPGFGYSRVGVFYHQNYQINSFLWGQAATWISERFIILTRHFDYYWRRLTVNHYWDVAVRFLRQDADGLSVLIRRSTFLVIRRECSAVHRHHWVLCRSQWWLIILRHLFLMCDTGQLSEPIAWIRIDMPLGCWSQTDG